MKLNINSIFSIAFALFLNSGLIKVVIEFYKIPFPDFTLLLGIFLLVLTIVKCFSCPSDTSFSKRELYALMLIIFFLIYIIISYVLGPSKLVAQNKLVAFSSALIGFLTVSTFKKIDVSKFSIWFVSINFILAIWYSPIIIQMKKGGLFYLNYLETKSLYLNLSYTLGISILLILIHKEFFNNNIFYRRFRILAIISLVALIIITGGRGGILFTIIIVLIYYILNLINSGFNIRLNKKIVTLGILSIPLVLLFFDSDNLIIVLDRAYGRFLILTEVISNNSSEEFSINNRFDQIYISFKLVFSSIQSFFIGHGFGAYGIASTGSDERLFPHNVILEILVELGFVGLFIFMLFHYIVFKNNINLLKSLSILIFLYIFLNHLKSFSLAELRIYFGFLGLYLLSPRLKNHEN